NLLGGGLLRSAVDLGHQKGLLSISVAQGFAHPDFALATVVIPAVIEEVDPAVEGRTDDADTFLLIGLHANVVSAESHHGDFLARAAQSARGNGFGGVGESLAERCDHCSGCGSLEKSAAVHRTSMRIRLGD